MTSPAPTTGWRMSSALGLGLVLLLGALVLGLMVRALLLLVVLGGVGLLVLVFALWNRARRTTAGA